MFCFLIYVSVSLCSICYLVSAATGDEEETDESAGTEEFVNEEGDDTAPDEDNTGDEAEDDGNIGSEDSSEFSEEENYVEDEEVGGEDDAETENTEGYDDQGEEYSGATKSNIFSNTTALSNMSSEVTGQVRAAVSIIFVFGRTESKLIFIDSNNPC